MIPPTKAQQMGMAYAQKPFALASFLAACYVIYYLLCKERQKLQRLFHRLILAMNVALLPLSFAMFLGRWPVPRGTKYFDEAVGTVATCTAAGFITIVFSITVPTYYASLTLHAFLSVKHNFREENYKYIEKWVHIVAYSVPVLYALLFAIAEKINPNATVCWMTNAPYGCETNPDIPCERGEDIQVFEYAFTFSIIFVYFIAPISTVVAMCCWMKKMENNMESSQGMQRIRASARKRMAKSIAKQISVYFFCFWITLVFTLIEVVSMMLTNHIRYNFITFGNVMLSSQGFVFAIAYFALQRMGGRPKVDGLPTQGDNQGRGELTVDGIRANAAAKIQADSETDSELDESTSDEYNFNIFDGTPGANSPWAKFIDQECSDSDEIEAQQF